MTEAHLRVLLVEDEASLREPLAARLRKDYAYEVVDVPDAAEAWQKLQKAPVPYDVALIDDLLSPQPGGQDDYAGIDLMRRLKQRFPDTECIVLTGWGMERALEALQAGAYRYLAKPLNLEELGVTIRMAAEQGRLRRERDMLTHMQEIGTRALSSQDVGSTLNAIAEAVRSLVGADSCAVALPSRAGRGFTYSPVVWLGEATFQWQRHFRKIHLTRNILRSGKYLYVADAPAIAARLNENLVHSGVQSFIGVPVPGEQGCLGVLYAYSTRRDAFGLRDRQVLDLLAKQAGLALADAERFQRIGTHAGYMEALVRAGQGLSQATNQEERLARVWDFVREQLHVSTFVICLFDGNRSLLEFPLAYDEGRLRLPPDQVLTDDRRSWGLAGYVVKAGEELLWITVEERRRLSKSVGVNVRRMGRSCATGFWLPLKAGERIVGAISIQACVPHAFDEITLNAFRALGSQLAAALENSRLLNEAQRRARDLEALQPVTATITSSLELTDVLQKTSKAAVEFFHADHSGLVLFNPDGTEGKVVSEYPPSVGTLDAVIQLRGVPREEQLVDEGQPVVVYDVAQDTALGPVGRLLYDKWDIQSILVVPVNSGGKRLGSFSLDSIGKKRRFTDAEVALCARFADQVAISIENARLFSEATDGRSLIQALHEASSAIAVPADPEELLKALPEAVCKATGGWRAAVLLLDEAGEPVDVATKGFEHAVDAATFSRPEGISRQVFRSRQARFFPNVGQCADELHPCLLKHGSKAAACLPLLVRDRAFGVLWIQFAAPHDFSLSERQALQVFANHAAALYDNDRRMQRLEHMRQAAEALAGAVLPKHVLQQIVASAKAVLQADSSLVWPYDSHSERFVPEEMEASGISAPDLTQLRQRPPRTGGTAEMVLTEQWLAVPDLQNARHDFMQLPGREVLDRMGVKSFQGVALRTGDETLGVLYANYHSRRNFGAEDREMVRAFAYDAALALKKARLLLEVTRSRETARVTAAMTTLGELDDTLAWVASGTKEALGCDIVTLYQYDQDRKEFGFPPTMLGVRDKKGPQRTGRVDDVSVVRNVLESEQMCVAEDAAKDELMRGPFVTREGVKSSVGIPLSVGARRVGVMFVNYRTRHRFTEEELTSIELFSNQAAVAIRNAQLYDEANKRANALEALSQAGQAVTSTLALDEILKRMAEQSWRLATPSGTGDQTAQFSHLSLLHGRVLRRAALWPPGCESRLAGNVGNIDLDRDAPIGITGRAASTGISQLAADVRQVTDYIVYDQDTRSELAVPIKVGDKVIGVINVEHPQVNAFDLEDQMALEALAAQAASAIENARQFEELKTTRVMVGARTALAWMGMASSAWRHSIEKHALTIQGQAQLLQNDLVREKEPRKAMEKRIGTIQHLTRQILEKPITPPLGSEEAGEVFDVDRLVSERLGRLWKKDPYQKAELSLQLGLTAPDTVKASPEWLRRAFDVLVDNAIGAVAASDVRQIVVRTRRRDGKAEVVVSDSGKGIREDVRVRLFRERIEEHGTAGGLGMGLLMAQAIAQAYGGDVYLESTGPEGTSMVLALPVFPTDAR